MLGWPLAGFSAPKHPVQSEIYLIIDDMGYRATDINAFYLPQAVAFSILPHTPKAYEFALKAHAQSRDVMLHLPMEAESDKPLGPGAITTSMLTSDVDHTIDSALASVPYAIGVNNHMGSHLTASGPAMQTVMSVLKQYDLFFLDSRTTRYSVAQQVAQEQNLPNARRHVFLDHEQSTEFMQEQWQRLLNLAQRNGKAIAIAHPHPETITFLKQKLAALPEQEVTLRPISQYFKNTPTAAYVSTNETGSSSESTFSGAGSSR